MLLKLLTTPGFDMTVPNTCYTWWAWTLPNDELFWVGTPLASTGFCIAISDENGEPIPSDDELSVTGAEEPGSPRGEGASPTQSELFA